jgi:predicted metal-dependent hydrolase
MRSRTPIVGLGGNGGAAIEWLRNRLAPTPAPVLTLAGRTLPLAIRRLSRARRMTLRLAPDGREVRLSMPSWGREAEALAFARSKRAWLEAQLAKLAPPAPPGPKASVPYRGAALRIDWSAEAPRSARLVEGALRIGGAAESLDARLLRWLGSEARRIFAEDLAHYCARAKLPPARLALSNAQRRWGSCSTEGVVRLNWRLMMAPDAVRRSVVAHEVAHLLHFDHSPKFHTALRELFEGDLAEADGWLKREGRSLYGPFG